MLYIVGCGGLSGSIADEGSERTLSQLTKLARSIDGVMNSSRVDGFALEEIPAIPWEEVHVQPLPIAA
jgi:hypothetical protein